LFYHNNFQINGSSSLDSVTDGWLLQQNHDCNKRFVNLWHKHIEMLLATFACFLYDESVNRPTVYSSADGQSDQWFHKSKHILSIKVSYMFQLMLINVSKLYFPLIIKQPTNCTYKAYNMHAHNFSLQWLRLFKKKSFSLVLLQFVDYLWCYYSL
jgi:hypothetical protein